MMDKPKISPAEWEVMRVLWREAPLPGIAVIEALAERTDWSPKTVRTLLARLVEKGVLTRAKRHGVYHFTPAVSEQECLRDESREFLSRFFSGRLQPMLSHFIEEEDIPEEELRKLRRMLDEKLKKGGQP